MYKTIEELAYSIIAANLKLDKNRKELELFVQFTNEFENCTIRDWRAFKNAHAQGMMIDEFKNLTDEKRVEFLSETLEFDSLSIFKQITE